MDEYKKNVLRELSNINLEIEKKQKVLLLMDVIKVNHSSSVFVTVKAMQSIINQCIQCGNYRRALRFFAATNRFLDEYAVNEASAIDKLTKMIIKE